MDVVELTQELVNIPSVTNDEGRAGALIAERLRNRVAVQMVPPDRDEKPAQPRLDGLAMPEPGMTPDGVGQSRAEISVRTTHLDTVPPFIPCTEDAPYLYGPGTCEPKGIFAAMWVAPDRLWSQGHRTVAQLGVAGEETASVGAKRVHEFTVPYLSKIGCPLLVEPGSIHDAHTSNENVGKPALQDAVEQYLTITTARLKTAPEVTRSAS